MCDAEPTLADVAREFPDWEPRRATSGLCYARAPGTELVMGEDPLDLRDQIRGWLGRHDDWSPAGTRRLPGGGCVEG
ncbi:MAG TPA: hypothetical protein VHY21_13525 [Pseudonocardiaceae bacterium]|nr:hypothetical protein [Pseudonocardiaceae bacterium]